MKQLHVEHPLVQRVVALAVEADESGYACLSNALVLIARASAMKMPSYARHGLVNTATMMIDTVEACKWQPKKK